MGGNYFGKGTLYLTNVRVIFVPTERNAHFHSVRVPTIFLLFLCTLSETGTVYLHACVSKTQFYVPLAGILDDKLDKPWLFGVATVTGKCPPVLLDLSGVFVFVSPILCDLNHKITISLCWQIPGGGLLSVGVFKFEFPSKDLGQSFWQARTLVVSRLLMFSIVQIRVLCL